MVIFATRYSNTVKARPSYIRKRSFKNFSPDDFKAAVQSLNFLDVYLCTEVDTAVKLLSEKITTILDNMAPMRTVQIRTNYNPWLSQQTKDLMEERDSLHKKAAETQNVEDWNKFKKLRNTINNRLKSEEKDWQREKN